VSPTLIAGALALVIGFGGGWTANGWRLNAAHDAETAERKQAENIAILQRVKNNERAVEQNVIDNRRITKEKNDAIDKVRADIASAPGLRVGSAICGGPAAGTEANSTGGGDGENTGGRVVREDVRRDIDAMKLEVENAFAAGRACQAFVRSKGMAPE
jgi:hypothetical protein